MAITDTFRMTGRTRARPTLRALTSLGAIDRSGLDAGSVARLDLFVAGIHRRWGWIILGAAVTGAGITLGQSAAGWGAVLSTAAAFAGVNFSLSAIPRATGYRGGYLHAAMALDLAVLAAPMALLGPGAASLLLALALLPYATSDPWIVRIGQAIVATLVFLAAVQINATLTAGTPIASISPMAWIGGGVVFTITTLIRWNQTRHATRVGAIRSLIERVEAGALYERSQIEQEDDLGRLQQSINRMLDRMSRTLTEVQAEANEVSVFAEVLSQTASGVLGSSEKVHETASTLANDMAEQRERAEGGQNRSATAAAAAAGLRDRADGVAAEVESLVTAARLGQERVHRASETLLAIGENVQTTATTVQELSSMSEHIGNFVHSISRIARQTHVLALNAAIEAAHADSRQEGFSAVADEVRALAATSADSARDATELIEDVRGHIDAVARAMRSGEEQVRDVEAVAEEAQAALHDLARGIEGVTDLVTATAQVSREQAQRMAGLAQEMSEVALVSSRASIEAQGAATSMGTQRGIIKDLSSVASKLAGLSERLRESVARFETDTPV